MSPVRINPAVSGVDNLVRKQTPKQVQGGPSFKDALNTQIEKQAQSSSGMKLSAHAEKRLAESNVQLGADQQMRLGAAMDRISQKGADKSLVLMDDLALVVSARNRTVITAVDSSRAKEGVFTNIDSAVIA